MSIFLEQHHDTLLFEYLSIDDLVVLSQVSKYYYKLTKHILRPFRIHHTIGYNAIHKIYLDIMDDTFIKFSINNFCFSKQYITKDITKDIYLHKMMMKVLKACKYGGIKIIEHYCKRYINVMNYRLDICINDNNDNIKHDLYSVFELALYICISNNNLKAIKFLCSLATFHKWYQKVYFGTNDKTIKHYCGTRSDEVIRIIEECGYFAM